MTIGQKPTNAQKVQKLREALHAKAKESPQFRFYSLYDKVYREDVLEEAFWQCRRNDGAPGVDGQTFTEIIDGGVKRWLAGTARRVVGGGRTSDEAVSSAGCPAGVHSQAGWQAAAVGDPHDQGPRRADGGTPGPGADF